MKARKAVRGLAALLALWMLPMTNARAEEDEIMEKISRMTLREKVGQLFIIRPDALEKQFGPAELEDNDIIGTTEMTEEMRGLYRDYPCGGFALFRKNILSPEQLRTLTADLHAAGDPAPVLAIDEEGGRVARIANHPASFGVKRIPSMGALGAAKDGNRVYETCRTIGNYLTDFGLDIDFAPVADVNSNPRKIIIGDRSFGSDPEAVAGMVKQAVRGFHDGGVATCIKHFPGHGEASADTHIGYSENLKTWEEMLACEMIPFRAGIEAGTDFVMTAHISAPMVTGTETPSTMSRMILTEKLRGELGFDGLIITDALSMGAIRERYSSSEACIACIEAGADILLMPYDYFEAFDGVVAAVEDGRISVERIEESLIRILRFKQTLAEKKENR